MISYSRGSSTGPGIEPESLASPALADRFFTSSTTSGGAPQIAQLVKNPPAMQETLV